MATKRMNPVVHFEMPAEDRDRMTRFYETTFGWKTEQLGPDMGDYVLVTTSETAARSLASRWRYQATVSMFHSSTPRAIGSA